MPSQIWCRSAHPYVTFDDEASLAAIRRAGPPVLAAATIIASFFSARRRWGIAVPLCALALLAADLVGLVATF